MVSKADVEICCPDEFRAAIKFAKVVGGSTKESFLRCVRNLNRTKRRYSNDYELLIYTDLNNFSFYWSVRRKPRLGPENIKLTGGMILHNYVDTIDPAATTPPTWEIHT